MGGLINPLQCKGLKTPRVNLGAKLKKKMGSRPLWGKFRRNDNISVFYKANSNLLRKAIMKIAYFDCFAGAGGDMIAAAFLDAGLDADFLKQQLKTLKLQKLNIKIKRVKRCGFRAVQFIPESPKQKTHRNLKQITDIISKSKIDLPAKKTAIRIFERLADAEAKVHSKKINDIHFHEVGAIDSIADIVSASVGYHFFKQKGIEKFFSSALSVGSGVIETAHGLMPVPAPATAELLKGVPVTAGPADFELLTPTASAILTTIVDEFCHLPSMKIEKVGCGAGSLDSKKFANILRLFIGQAVKAAQADMDSVYLLETNIDDATAEQIGYTSEKLLEAGALDVFTTPIYMKYNRPAVKLSAICSIKDEEKITQLILEQGLTFGIRKQLMARSKLVRGFVTVQTKFGKIRIKTGTFGGKIVNAKPEFEDCKRCAEKFNVPIKTVTDAALKQYRRANK